MEGIKKVDVKIRRVDRASELDLLRFLAALLVLLYHYATQINPSTQAFIYPGLNSVFKYGFFGVEIFFMISGFVILLSALNKTPKQFILARMIRLYPAFWICVTLTALFSLLGAKEQMVTWGQYFANLTMLSHFFGIPDVDGAYWTLYVELRFYFLVFLIILLKKTQNIEPILGGWMLLTLLAIYLNQPAFFRFFLLTNWSPYFIAGALFFLIWQKGSSYVRIFGLFVCWFIAILTTLERAALEPAVVSKPIVVLLVSVLFIIFGVISSRRISSRFSKPWIFILGGVSYPLYLLHQNIGHLLYRLGISELHPWILLIGVSAFIMLLAYGVYRFERLLNSKMKNK